ncbi:sensor histidine kinase [Cellulosimicrobium sp. CpK407]|uniref:sensor histidine kinase n=1 Tax=Cellulosimicrobium sp. CpK407 TaxID=3229847 RepID=UPI003F366C77
MVATTPSTTPAVRIETSCDEAPTSGDPLLLEQLVRNLVENAERYNLRHDGWVRVATRSDAGGDAVLEVVDPGPPVAPDDLPGLFEPFRRLGGERTGDGTGSGLGLSIVRAVVGAHGGSVTLAARPEDGLVVTVRLPGEVYDEVPASPRLG